MQTNNKTILSLFILAACLLILAACSRPEAPAEDESLPQSQEPAPSSTIEMATSPAKPPLPPPVILTSPAGSFNLPDPSQFDSLEADSLIDPPADLPFEVQLLVDEIQRGEYQFEQPAGSDPGVQATYTYSDVDRDGVQDLVIVVVADQGGISSISAGSLPGGPEIRLAPLSANDVDLQAISIPAETLAKLAAANGIEQDGAIILTLTGAQPE